STQAWAADDSPVLVTRFTRDALTVEQEDFVAWQTNVLVRRVRVSGITATTRLVAYAAMAPCNARTPEFPMDDWAFDIPATGGPVDFALFYSSKHSAFVHFRPAEDRVSSLRTAAVDAVMRASASSAAADAEIAALDSNFPLGSTVAWGAAANAAFTASTMTYADRPMGLPAPAFEDADDAELSSSTAA